MYTEFSFTLPQGFLDSEGKVHRVGRMRPATGKDELFVQKNTRLQEFPEYNIFLILSRVITALGNLTTLTPNLLEQLFLRDFLYLQQLYYQINQFGGEGMTEGE